MGSCRLASAGARGRLLNRKMPGGWLSRWRERRALQRRPIPEPLWHSTLAHYAFLGWRPAADLDRLRVLATLFLAEKEFSGAHGFVVTDRVAVAIAAQACLPVLEFGLEPYAGFVGIVVHADAVSVRRSVQDDDGIIHEYDEELAGEVMHGGPMMLSWRDVEEAGDPASPGYNVVIHEFAHVLDMRNGGADGVPVLPGLTDRDHWIDVLDDEFQTFCERVDAGEETLLDPYAAEAPEEFFAVASEMFFVSPIDLRHEHPAVYKLLRTYYRQDTAAFQSGEV